MYCMYNKFELYQKQDSGFSESGLVNKDKRKNRPLYDYVKTGGTTHCKNTTALSFQSYE